MIFDKDTLLREFEFPNVIGGIEHKKSPGIGGFEPPNILIIGNDEQQNTTVAKTILYGKQGKQDQKDLKDEKDFDSLESRDLESRTIEKGHLMGNERNKRIGVVDTKDFVSSSDPEQLFKLTKDKRIRLIC